VRVDQSTVAGSTGVERVGGNGKRQGINRQHEMLIEWKGESTYRSPIFQRFYSSSESKSSTSESETSSSSLARSRWCTVTGQPESCRAAMNFPIASMTGPDGFGPGKKRFCSAGNTSVTLSPESSCREGAINATESLRRPKSVTEVNGRKSSSH
jgi:hypothetical protein